MIRWASSFCFLLLFFKGCGVSTSSRKWYVYTIRIVVHVFMKIEPKIRIYLCQYYLEDINAIMTCTDNGANPCPGRGRYTFRPLTACKGMLLATFRTNYTTISCHIITKLLHCFQKYRYFYSAFIFPPNIIDNTPYWLRPATTMKKKTFNFKPSFIVLFSFFVIFFCWHYRIFI